MKSIRRRLFGSLFAVLFLLVAVFGAVLFVHAHQVLLGQFDADLVDKARAFAATSEIDEKDGLEFEFAETALPEFQPSPQAEYYQVWSSEGASLIRSPSLGQGQLQLFAVRPPRPQFADLDLPDGRAGRAVAIAFAAGEEDFAAEDGSAPKRDLTLVMASSREMLDHELLVLLLGVCLAGIILPACAGVLVHWIVKKGLQPLDQVAQQAASMDARQLDLRFPQEGIPAELRPICGRLNDLFSRLEEAFSRERRFTADAAHELRTPIAELRTLAEVALGDVEAESWRAALADVLEVAVQMGGLVEALLARARCESGRQHLERRDVDLADSIQGVWQKFEAAARDKELVPVLQLPTSLPPVNTDPTLLKAILTNLVSNAVSHTPKGGRLELAATAGERGVSIAVSNTNDSLTADDLPHLFESFWCKDAARTDTLHAGLGLCLVDAYARLLGARVDAALPAPDRFTVSLEIPTA